MPPDPPRIFLFLNQLQLCLAEKTTLEKTCENYALPLLKFLATPLFSSSLIFEESKWQIISDYAWALQIKNDLSVGQVFVALKF